MKHLGSRVNLIPVIAKADTLTPNDLAKFKRNVINFSKMRVNVQNCQCVFLYPFNFGLQILEVVEAQGIRLYTCPIESDDESTTNNNKDIMSALPFSVIGSTEDVVTADNRKVKGRQYSWGCAEVENEDHCDFKKLRTLLIRSHMHDLISTTEETHYENYRQIQMETRKFGEAK